ncbi:acyltransferase family protein [Mesorhizobium sp. IMUNJ 23033]|uniref:acyltransferase family protein n=1 Tax=Mesorhizobium sp. IMUNJ 23033 TaxID=3378039 RepID=UPI0038517766
MSRRLYGLDALRGVAAIAVAAHHLVSIYGFPLLPLGPSIAVDLFFILSGFVMARTYEDRLRNDLSTRGFITLRYRRLFLPLAIGSTIGLASVVAVYGHYAQAFASYALVLCFLPSIGPAAFPLNVPAWSLFVEIVCNALHGSFFSKLSNMQLKVAAVASILLFVACSTKGLTHWGPGITAIIWLIPRELSCYLAGMWTFRQYGDAPLGGRPILAIGAFVLMLCLASINASLEMMALVACPLIIRASLGLPRMRWVIWAGALSYPLYATHVPVLQASRAMGLHPALGAALVAVVAAFVTVAFEMRRPARQPVEAF